MNLYYFFFSLPLSLSSFFVYFILFFLFLFLFLLRFFSFPKLEILPQRRKFIPQHLGGIIEVILFIFYFFGRGGIIEVILFIFFFYFFWVFFFSFPKLEILPQRRKFIPPAFGGNNRRIDAHGIITAPGSSTHPQLNSAFENFTHPL